MTNQKNADIQERETMTETIYANAPNRTVDVGGTKFAYRELGPKGGIPVIFFVHLAATLDNWNPRIIDAIAKNHHTTSCEVPLSPRPKR